MAHELPEIQLAKSELFFGFRVEIGISCLYMPVWEKVFLHLASSKIVRFLFPEAEGWGTYAFVALRVVVAAFWLHSDIPRWMELAAGHPEANGVVRNLFGIGMVVPLTYFFTALETLGAISFLLGLLTPLAAVWGVVEFAIIAAPLLLTGIGEQSLVHALLFSASLVLLLNGSPTLSLDGLIAKHVTTR